MKRSQYLWVFLAVSIASGCSRSGEQAPATNAVPAIRSLNEIPMDQLRVFLRGYPGDWRGDTGQSQGVPMPTAAKGRADDAHVIPLPAPDELDLGTMSVAEAVKGRRSRREYTEEPLSLEQLSFLLWCTQGVRSTVKDDEGRIVRHFRTVPSGGARHPFETYLLVQRVEGLYPGLYRFLPFEHALLPLYAVDELSRVLQTLCYGEEFVGRAAVIFAWAAVPYRTEWRYAYLAHRMIAMEAGHVCQNLYLACESIGVGTCAVLGYDQAGMDALIGVDGQDEFTMYMATVGSVRQDGAE